jgi:hypothetical protein
MAFDKGVHMRFRPIASVVVVAGMMAIASLGIIPDASAHPTTTTNPASFSHLQAKLEAQLAVRQTQLATLTTDVSSSTTLTTADAAALSASLSVETTNIGNLITKVPSDTTITELRTDQHAMFQDNRVFVVMSPQVRLTIAADTLWAKAGAILSNGPTITADLAARVADKGYARAEARFAFSTAKATVVQSSMTGVSAKVLAQTPAGWPANEHIFVKSGVQIVRARGDLVLSRVDLKLVERWIAEHAA